MSKVVATLVAGSGAATAAVGGTYLMRQGIGEISSSDKEPTGSGEAPSSQPEVERTLTFENLEAFKNEWKTKSKCVKDFFEGEFNSDDKASTATVLQGSSVPTTDTFFKSGDDAQSSYKSCLIIDGKKDNYTDNKWKGKFTWTGSFVKGNEGFVNFNIAETSSEDKGKLEFKGVFYLLGKGTGSENNWEVKYRKDSKTGVKADSSTLDQHFPKKGSNINSDKGDYWGFIDSADKLNDTCEKSACTSQDGVNPKDGGEKLHWVGSKTTDSESKKFKDGTADLGWGSKIYGDTPGSLSQKIESFEGTGTLQSQ